MFSIVEHSVDFKCMITLTPICMSLILEQNGSRIKHFLTTFILCLYFHGHMN